MRKTTAHALLILNKRYEQLIKRAEEVIESQKLTIDHQTLVINDLSSKLNSTNVEFRNMRIKKEVDDIVLPRKIEILEKENKNLKFQNTLLKIGGVVGGIIATVLIVK